MTTERPQLTWSRLSVTPVLAYHPRSHSHIAYWNGVGMTRSHALLLVNNQWQISYATPKMRELAYQEFLRAYDMGAFGSVDWRWEKNSNAYLMGLVRWITKDDTQFFHRLHESYSVQAALRWFSPENESIIDE
jgi:hypothetical protein